MHAPDRRRSVRAGLRAVEQRLEIDLQVRRVRFRALSVDTSRAVLAREPVGFTEKVDVDVMSERPDRHARCALRQFRYSFESR